MIKALSMASSDSETTDDAVLLERRVLRALRRLKPFCVTFVDSFDAMIATTARQEAIQWCGANAAGSFLITSKRSIYFDQETDATLCFLTFR
jgi:hypothetical protein